MSAIMIRNLPEKTHQALEARARRNGRTTEAEISAILQTAAASEEPLGIGSYLKAIGQSIGGIDLDDGRDREAYEPPSFK
ncbi:TraY domain-containing protein [Rhizobium sp. NFR03]|uniref:FitA-like ribbon-helix-helix domain-containing protein n=1 Tax=Rhizobium sp. NFR03 TaxID=1566263 RepID=UPI0008B45537|nr:TraY domain-containing protein [Rhizobium sp. NFR03]SER99506.1 TraY domain-containing protein [Rhizobium sp. NFR03]